MISDIEILTQVSKFLFNPSIIVDKISNDTKEIILNIVRREICKCNSLSDLCKNIANQLDNKLSKQWHCFMTYDSVSKSFHHLKGRNFISLSFGKLKIEIFKSPSVSIKILKLRYKILFILLT